MKCQNCKKTEQQFRAVWDAICQLQMDNGNPQ